MKRLLSSSLALLLLLIFISPALTDCADISDPD
jgi:hypothetical protein